MKYCPTHHEDKQMDTWNFCPICGAELIEVAGMIMGMPVLTQSWAEFGVIVSTETDGTVRMMAVDNAKNVIMNAFTIPPGYWRLFPDLTGQPGQKDS